MLEADRAGPPRSALINSILFYDTEVSLARPSRQAQTCHAKARSQETEDATMRRVKRASRKKRTTKVAAVTVVGAAGLGLSLFGSASGSTMPTAYIPQSDTSPNQRFILGEEEMQDVSLATFHLLDRENVGSAIQLARGGCGGCGCGHGGGGCGHGCGGCGHAGFGGCGHVGVGGCARVGVGGCGRVGVVVGCRGCGAFRGCRGFRGCGCGGCGFVGFGFDDFWWSDDWGTWGACCASWGACRLC